MEVRVILKTHRAWEGGTGLLLGLTIGLSPWLAGVHGQLRKVAASLIGITISRS